MKAERNAPCPCGSGKKFKKCCGAPARQERPRPDYFAVNRLVAYKGAVGRRREAFCTAYAALKAARLAEIENKLRQETAATGENVSCSPGCVHCCSQYVVASLQECECIVHYLYRHDEALMHLLEAFDAWKDRVTKIEATYRKINELGEKIMSGRATGEERQLFKQESRAYAGEEIPCPFLADGACIIYPVRPYVCAGYYSVSPQDWCRASHPDNSRAMHIKITLQIGSDMPYFLKTESSRIYSPLPLLVHQLLEGGYGALADIIGLEDLKAEALSDPEMRAALSDAGVYPNTSVGQE